MLALIAAIVFGACAWHFAWRQAAYWSTGEQVTEAQSRRAGALSDVFGCTAAAAGVITVVFIALSVRARRRAVT